MSTAPYLQQVASTAARSRQSRKNRLTRFSVFTTRRNFQFKVRKSLVEYVDEELDQLNTSVFYQRIYILAKNLPIGGKDVKLSAFLHRERKRLLQAQLEREALEHTSVDSVTTQTSDLVPEPEVIRRSTRLSEAKHSDMTVGPVASAAVSEIPLVSELDKEEFTKGYKFDEDKTIECVSPSIPEEEQEVEESSETGGKDFYTLFMERITELHDYCMERMYTPDPLCGLYLHMGEYSILVLESCEDMLGMFCNELDKCSEEFWESNRIFQVEDKISDIYFDELIGRRIPAAVLNEKFPPSTPSDEYLMGKQHLIIKQKIKTICSLLSSSLRAMEETEQQCSDSSCEEEASTPAAPILNVASAILPLDPFRQLLPEIQRIDLVLSSTRFYNTLSEYRRIYGTIPLGNDEDNYVWPIPNNYMPPHIFERSEFDINLTFGEYGRELRLQSIRSTYTEVPEEEEEDAATVAGEATSGTKIEAEPE